MSDEPEQGSESEAASDTEADTGSDAGSDSSEEHAEGAHSEENVEEIEAERERRLDEDNRPEGAIVDNSGEMPDVVKEFDEENPPDTEGTSDPAEKFREIEVSEEEKQEIEEERERRLDPENRPENAEVDNTGRTFEDGKFVDDGEGGDSGGDSGDGSGDGSGDDSDSEGSGDDDED